MMRMRSLEEAALEEVPGVSPPLAVVSDPPQTRSSWSVSQDMENRNDCMPERAFVLGKGARRCCGFLLLLPLLVPAVIVPLLRPVVTERFSDPDGV